MLSNAQLILEIKQLKFKIGLYEISTKSDYEKISMLQDLINKLSNILNINNINFNIDELKI